MSVVALSARRDQADVGAIGREGCTAVEVVLGCDRAHYDAVVQIPGPARRIHTDTLVGLCHRSASLQGVLLRYAYMSLVQARDTALANARGTISQRLARWILMAAERMSVRQLSITHDDLSVALGVRRAGVTIALGRLADAGIIQLTRGRIEVLDVSALMDAAKGYYAVGIDHMTSIEAR